jgi:hypothetical protein
MATNLGSHSKQQLDGGSDGRIMINEVRDTL